MNMVALIQKKKDGKALQREEIQWIIDGYVAGSIPDYQISALLMAICFQGLDKEETFALTEAMRDSGDTIDLSPINGIKVDKHSTGGVGDKTTLVVAPLASACGVPVAKMSGRGLGFTGGTVDKMESIPGFRTTLEPSEFLAQVNAIGMAVIGQTAHITPADKKLYALRDVTATVDNFGLIASSIMSKKLAAGSDAIVLDVKVGDGAFMENLEDAVTLAKLMVEIGNSAGRRTVAAITEMGQPLGKAVGNSLEVIEAIETLKGNGPADITELALKLSGIMVYLGGKASSLEEGMEKTRAALTDGRGLSQLRRFIAAQGGNEAVVDDYSLFPQHTVEKKLTAETSGYVRRIEARCIGLASQHTGAGRATKEDTVDLSAGVYVHRKVGDAVQAGEVLATFYGNDEAKVDAAAAEASKAFTIGTDPVEAPKLIKEIIGLETEWN
ncbi:MAG: pyrimidine-nucleoside phosphorylase [Firmicutes bacterium]|nr:pyrimidine-nucleoside phosphorylase [Bacillota bacterium]MDY5857566.1 pyrimidine-nucleoside phosphorylase [Anaerovoracaceae bacterium]